MNDADTALEEALDGGIQVVPPRGYKVLCIVNLLASSVASLLCIILIVAMMVPLLYRKRRKYYSTYNLYLAFMAIPDLIQHVFVVYLVLTHEQWNPHPYIDQAKAVNESASFQPTNLVWLFDYRWDHSITTMAVTWNLYVNAFLTREIYRLLRSSNKWKKHPPPTIARVTAHAMISYVLGVIIFFLPTLLSYVLSEDVFVNLVHGIPYFVFVLMCVAVIPLSVVVWFSYQIVRQELLRSTESMYEGRLRILVVYFARIVLTDVLLWIPAVTLYYLAFAVRSASFATSIVVYNTSLLFVAFQSMALFACSLFKPDARKLIIDLVCGLVYCRRGSCGEDHASRRCSVTDPYLWRLAAPGQESVMGTLGSSQENSWDDMKDNDDDNNDHGSKNLDREDIDPEDIDSEDIDPEHIVEGA